MTANNLRDAMINELGEASELLPPLEKKKLFKKIKIFHICSSFFSAHKARRWRGRKISFVKILFFFFLVKFLGPCSLPFLLPLPASCSLPSLDVVKLLNGHRHKNASVSWSLLQFFFSFVNGRVTVLYGPRLLNKSKYSEDNVIYSYQGLYFINGIILDLRV